MVTDEIDGKYKQHVVAIYREKLKGNHSPNDEEIRFTRSDVDYVEDKYGIERVKNPADIVSNLRGNDNFPEELTKDGFVSVIRAYETGAVYYITKREQKIDLPDVQSPEKVDTSGIPSLVREYVYGNEQSILTQVRYIDLVSEFLGFDNCYHCQDHLQTAEGGGQAEIDSLYVAEKDGKHYAILMEGKNKGDSFIRNQLYINAKTIASKDEFPDNVLSIGMKIQGKDVFSLVEFDVPKSRKNAIVKVGDVKHYSFNQTTFNDYN